MKIIIYIPILFILHFSILKAQNKENIISYYAVGNSLDGQPLLNSDNKLRFFPVYAFRDSTESVKVTVYYGANIYSRTAQRMDEGRYWEALLPNLFLGEAIQRLEVETKIKINSEILQKQKEAIKGLKNNQETEIKNKIINLTNDYLSKTVNNLTQLTSNLNTSTDKTKFVSELTINVINIQNSILELRGITTQSPNNDEINKKLEEVSKLCSEIITNDSKKLDEISSNIIMLEEKVKNIKELKIEIIKNIESFFKEGIEKQEISFLKFEDSLKASIANSMVANFVTEDLAGPEITKADIILDKDLKYAKILYRNYKRELRQMPALDPAEKLGVFRLRYVPFPISGNKLYRPLTENSLTVFEIGLGFGNVSIPGDEFVKPTFSFDRLGVAIAITEKLFNNDAEILALALTYDFNLYGSIGAGVNFKDPTGKEKVKSYFSFGINKTAFEFLVSSLAKIFGK